MLDPPGFL